MCGRFTLYSSADEIAAALDVAVADLSPRYNVAPSQEVGAVLPDETGTGRQWAWLKWGLVPSWAKDPGIGHSLINARAETVRDKPAFRSALRRRRCLIPASGFFEWSAQGKKKQPHFFAPQNGKPFAFAGLWERWQGGDEEILSCAIVTTEANGVVQPVHGRMPVILPPDAYSRWLDPALTDPDALVPLLQPYPADAMRSFPVSTRVNSPRSDDPACVEPLA